MSDPKRSYCRCLRPGPPWNSPASLYWEPIVENGEVTGVDLPRLPDRAQQRAIRGEKALVIRRLKRGLPLE